ncbi:cell division transport system permease protein [Desulfobotulus alkaliphilus]|uniref:Cell division protein FtsX n=1 Tax=Desulfobotulus alkaliphilus TaxID=622671 RepID=A0A562S4G4_9BACT|nr:permease-like cell division protein FtsX [Desulfobotulus alkaliphilus]TWI75550.1 cell division transport system permease protein [Desulfobotulus alkaliphilus]
MKDLWIRHFRHALKDMRSHRFLHGITWITIVLSIILSGTFTLFASNAADVISSWRAGVRILAYLEEGHTEQDRLRIHNILKENNLISDVRFISKTEALESLRSRMQRHSAVFQNLPENPLPDAFELRVRVEGNSWDTVEEVALYVEKIKNIEDVEYGGQWVGRFLKVIAMLRLAALGMGSLFFLISVFIVANTIRLAFYSRKEEVEIMRLVGAEEGFIKAPFYIQGLILGFSGGLGGMLILFLTYITLTFRMDATFTALAFDFSFLPLHTVAVMVGVSTLIGWMGAYLSFRQEVVE